MITADADGNGILTEEELMALTKSRLLAAAILAAQEEGGNG